MLNDVKNYFIVCDNKSWLIHLSFKLPYKRKTFECSGAWSILHQRKCPDTKMLIACSLDHKSIKLWPWYISNDLVL